MRFTGIVQLRDAKTLTLGNDNKYTSVSADFLVLVLALILPKMFS